MCVQVRVRDIVRVCVCVHVCVQVWVRFIVRVCACRLMVETDAPYMGFKGCRKQRKYPLGRYLVTPGVFDYTFGP